MTGYVRDLRYQMSEVISRVDLYFGIASRAESSVRPVWDPPQHQSRCFFSASPPQEITTTTSLLGSLNFLEGWRWSSTFRFQKSLVLLLLSQPVMACSFSSFHLCWPISDPAVLHHFVTFLQTFPFLISLIIPLIFSFALQTSFYNRATSIMLLYAGLFGCQLSPVYSSPSRKKAKLYQCNLEVPFSRLPICM